MSNFVVFIVKVWFPMSSDKSSPPFKRVCIREEFSQGKNDLTTDAWSVVSSYIPNQKKCRRPLWKLASLTFASQQVIVDTFHRRSAMCLRIHQRLRTYLTEIKNEPSVLGHIDSERFHHAIHCSDKYSSHCKMENCCELKHQLDKSPFTIYPRQFLREHLTEDITPYPFRYAHLDDDNHKWRVVAWFVFRYGCSIIYNADVDNALQIAYQDSFEVTHVIQQFSGLSFLLTWYIRITTEIKNIHGICRMFDTLTYAQNLCNSTLVDSFCFLVDNWLFASSSLRRPYSHISDPIEDDMYTDGITYVMDEPQYVSDSSDDEENPTFDDENPTFDEEYDEHEQEVTEQNNNGLTNLNNLYKFTRFSVEQLIIHVQSREVYVIDNQTDVAYNILMENVGVYDRRLSHVFLYRAYNIRLYFHTALHITYPNCATENFASPMSKKERCVPYHMLPHIYKINCWGQRHSNYLFVRNNFFTQYFRDNSFWQKYKRTCKVNFNGL